MTAFEEIQNNIREALYTRFAIEDIKEIEDIVCVALEKYDITARETGVVVYDGGDADIMRRYFLAKAVQGCTQMTAKTYATLLEAFFKETQRHIADITPDDIRIYLAKKKIMKRSDCYLATIHRALSSFFSWCASEDIIQKNPMVKVEKIKVRKKIEEALTDEQMEMLRYAARTKRESALIEFLYSTGCRISEVCSLNISDVNLQTGEIEVLGKGKKFRKVYLSQRARFSIADYLKSRKDNSPALFAYDLDPLIGGLKESVREEIGEDGRLSSDAARSLFKTISKRVGFRVHPHLLRKTVATLALRKGMPIDQVKQMLGHESIATTTIYAQTQSEDVKRAHEKYV